VDPYYLTHKAQALGYLPEVILSGRRINDGMGKYVAEEIVKLMIKKGCRVLDSRVLQLGITFKENCPDIRNSHAARVTAGLMDFGCEVDVYDPWADPDEVEHEYGFRSMKKPPSPANYDAIALTVAHRDFENFELAAWKSRHVVFDVRVLPRAMVDGRL
jgi:UDP-N-acetyl-D-galactosamine dehydrogenase